MAAAKKRHGCLTVWLIFMIAANSAVALMYLLGAETIRGSFRNAPGWAFPVLIVFSLFNLVCVIALFQWKKWGFWGCCGSSVVGVVVNLSIGLKPASVVLGMLGVLLLYGVLHIGKENKGWPQLE